MKISSWKNNQKKEIKMNFEENFKKPPSFFRFALDFIKSNPSVILSLALLVFMPLALYFNTFFTLRSFENFSNQEIQRKSVMIENIIDSFVDEKQLENPGSVQDQVDKIKANEDEIYNLEIFVPEKEKLDSFKVVAAFDKNSVGQISSEMRNIFAWNNPSGATGFLDFENNQRLWKVEKILKNEAGDPMGLVAISLSLKKTDQLTSDLFQRSYLILFATIVIVLLFVLNHTRLFRYAVSFAKLKEVDEMKDNFISMASHELRSPLSAMRAYLSFFKEKELENVSEKGKEYISSLDVSVNRLDSLVDDILEVSRLEQNRIPFEIESVDPGGILASSIKELKSKAIEKNLEIVYADQKLPAIMADPDRLKQIVVNLLSNAIKYTPRGKVEIAAKIRHRKFLDITVADSGTGISAENQKFLFQKFFRAQNKETADVPGTGLGLWITRELARKMKGDVTVESIEGVGSHFTASFPLAKKN
jgi:signal transduction histidine kinase